MLLVATSLCKVCRRPKACMTCPKQQQRERNGLLRQVFAPQCITSRNMLVLGLSAPWLISIRMQFTWMLEFVSEHIHTYQRQLECRPPSWLDFWLSAHAFRHSLNWVGCNSVSSKSQILTPSESRYHNSHRLLPVNSVA